MTDWRRTDSSIFELQRLHAESWRAAAVRVADIYGLSAEVNTLFDVQLEGNGGDERRAAIDALLELDILPLRREGVSGT